MRSKYINTFPNNTAYQAYLDSSLWDYPNVAHIMDPSTVIYLKQSTEPEPEPEPVYALAGWVNQSTSFRIKINNSNYYMTVDTDKYDPDYGYFWYLEEYTGANVNNIWLASSIDKITKVTQFHLPMITSGSGNWSYSFAGHPNMVYFNFCGADMSRFTNWSYAFHTNESLAVVDFSGCELPTSGLSTSSAFNTCHLQTVIADNVSDNTFDKIKGLVQWGNPADLSAVEIHRDGDVYKCVNDAWVLQ